MQSPSSERNDASDVEGDEVDWAQLDKTEEQEPRGESSDEVCTHIPSTPCLVLITEVMDS